MLRFERFALILIAAYLTLLGGSPYYLLSYPIRVAHHLIMTGLLAGWLIVRFGRGHGLPRTPLTLPLIGVLVVMLLTTLTSRDARVSLEIVWFPFTFVLMYLFIASLIEDGKTRLVLEIYLLLGAVVVLIALLQLGSWWFGWNLVPGTAVGWAAVGQWPPVSPRLLLPLGVTTWLAAYTAPLAIFAVGKALTERQRDLRWALWGLAALLVIVLLLTNSRGGIIALAAGGAAFGGLRLLAWERFRRLSRPQQIGFVLLPAALLAVIAAGVLIWSQTRSSSDALRLSLWRGAVSMVSDSPLVGVGPGGFGRAYRELRDPLSVDDRLSTAHNLFLNTAAETGILGLLALLILIGAGAWAAFRRWQAADRALRIRLEAAAAALIGFGVQSQFDLFTATPILLLVIGLAALLTVTPRDRTQPRPRAALRWQLAAAVLLIGVVGFGAVRLNWDRAHGWLIAGTRGAVDPLTAAQTAQTIDPALRLYRLWEQSIIDTPSAYTRALLIEPTWEVGWLRLAALHEAAGDYPAALAALDRARQLRTGGGGALHWGRLAETHALAPAEAIRAAYRSALIATLGERVAQPLALAAFWSETALRREVVLAYADTLPLMLRYAVYALHAPDRLPEIVALADDSPAGDWVRGQAALAAGDTEAAIAAFRSAVSRAPATGEYHVALGRALYAAGQPDAAERALITAELLGTLWERPGFVRADYAAEDADRRAALLAALPPQYQDFNFEGVLYVGRIAGLTPPPALAVPILSADGVRRWQALADELVAAGDTALAAAVLRQIGVIRLPEGTIP